MHSSPLHILIIGGGIGGTALALFLKKAGFSSTVYEAHAYSRGIGGGLGLAPNGMNVLAALGLAEHAKARGSRALENVFYNQQGRVLARMKNGTVEKYGQPGLSVMRTALQEMLTKAAQQQGIQIQFQKRLVHITCKDRSVTAHFEDGTSAEGNLLIGADGVHSQTRSLILPDAPKPYYVGIIGIGGVTAAADVPMMTQREKQSFNFTYGAKGFFGYAGIADGDVVWWSNLPREQEMTKAELADVSLDIIRKDMLAIYNDYHEPIPTLLRNSHSPVKHNIHDIQSLPTWHKGRVLLMGDAAHAVNPNSGQGASMALEDAMYLAKLLRHNQDYERVFAQFEQDRKPRVERIVAEGRRRGEDKQVVTPLQQRVREVMMMIFINLFGTKGMDWLYSYKIDWENSV
jgi:2-polyprenyl-6-methoxyphenol hydroxylase-like FAD-dependent oxidoreductase